MAHAQRERYAEMVDKKLRASLVTVDSGTVPVFNTRYEGSPKAGAVKIPVRDAEIAIGDYDKGTGKAPTTGTTTFLTVTDFNDKAVNEIIDGYDAESVPGQLVADRLDSAGYTGALTLDADAIATLEAEGTLLADTTALTADTAYTVMVDIATQLTTNNVPMGSRFVIVSPAVHGLLLKDTKNFIRQGDLSQALVQQGYVGQVAGLNVKVSNNVDANTEAIAGHADWCHRIREWVKTPWVQNLDGDANYIGASAVKGRWVYKHAVSKSAAVLVKTKA
ncbi:hypothetical protein LJC60_01080 [Ruminococcaceae bacterium OttesenSCG-928-D13]|nr:hypothetical protein [Ruminococcaceae bacterium OttesenSCG-928-D13]